MGTKIQANSFLREYRPVINIDGSTSNGMKSVYHENQITKNDQNPDTFMARICRNGYSGYSPEKVRQTILEQESIFRNQVQELHRLHARQQELMNEIKRREINKDEDAKRTGNNVLHFASLHSLSGYPSTSGTGSKLFPSFLEDKSLPVFPKRTYDLGVPIDVYSSTMEKQMQERFSKWPGAESNSGSWNHRGSFDRDTKLSLSAVQMNQRNGDASANSSSNFNLVTKDFFKTSRDGVDGESSLDILGLRNEKSGNKLMPNEYSGKPTRFDRHSPLGDFCSGKSPAFPQSLFAEPRKESLNCPLDTDTSVSQRKRKIFGVEISVGNDDPFNAFSKVSSSSDPKAGSGQENHRVISFESSSWIANSFVQSLGGGSVNDCKNERLKAENDPGKCFKNLDDVNAKPAEVLKKDCQKSQEITKGGGLPWFLRNSQVSGDLKKVKKSSYFMNLDSLQNCSEKFFKKAETAEGAFQTLKEKTNISPPIANSGDTSNKVKTDGDIPKNQLETYMRHHIDLNLSLDDEDVPSVPSVPTAVVKIAATEIDLEAPAVIESETDTSSKKCTYEECDKHAAEAIMAISLSEEKNLVDDGTCEPPEDVSIDRLKWLAATIISSSDDVEESIPDGMDYFEFMTLKLEDTTEQAYHYKPVVLKNPSDDENCKAVMLSKRSRRGRQRKDFQRDILPSLVTLSRLEVNEDFQAFEELLKGKGDTSKLGSSQRSSTRNGRVRRRTGGPTLKALCTTPAKQPTCQLEERSLTGWGKRTRRLPRQRCNSALLSFAVKC